ncbi:hypothetical protein ACFQ1S_30280, partial [Kibdelosporangium lantanae]
MDDLMSEYADLERELADPAVRAELAASQPWYEQATGRLEIHNRVALWRELTGDDTFDIDYWISHGLYEKVQQDRPEFLLSNNNEDTPIMDTIS